jgi:hypothetical protein
MMTPSLPLCADEPIDVSDIKLNPGFSASVFPQEAAPIINQQLEPLPTPTVTKTVAKKKRKSGKKVTAHGDYVALC